MDWFRIRHTIGLHLAMSGTKRAKYIKKHNVFASTGDNCMFMFRKVPLYPKLIKIHNNVWIASNVSLVTHDVIHRMLNNKNGNNGYQEKMGCIEIGNNVFVGANTTILYNVRICDDVIIGAGSLINKDIVKSGVYAGVPVRYISSLEEYEEKLKLSKKGFDYISKTGFTEKSIEEYWKQFNANR